MPSVTLQKWLTCESGNYVPIRSSVKAWMWNTQPKWLIHLISYISEKIMLWCFNYAQQFNNNMFNSSVLCCVYTWIDRVDDSSSMIKLFFWSNKLFSFLHSHPIVSKYQNTRSCQSKYIIIRCRYLSHIYTHIPIRNWPLELEHNNKIELWLLLDAAGWLMVYFYRRWISNCYVYSIVVQVVDLISSRRHWPFIEFFILYTKTTGDPLTRVEYNFYFLLTFVLTA